MKNQKSKRILKFNYYTNSNSYQNSHNIEDKLEM